MVTVPSTPRISTIDLATASAGPFEVGFRLFDGDAVEVYVDGDRMAAGFTISTTFSDGYDDNATITFDVALDAGTEIKLFGKMAPARGADYGPAGVGLAGKLNLELGRIWTALVELRYGMDRALRGFNEAPIGDLEAGRAIYWDGAEFTVGPTMDEIANAQAAAGAASDAAEAAAESAEEAAQFDPTNYLTKSGNLSGLQSQSVAQDNLGFSSIGKALATAVTQAAGRTAIGLGEVSTYSLATLRTAYSLAQSTWNAGTGTTQAMISPFSLKEAVAALSPGATTQVFTSGGVWTNPGGGRVVFARGWGGGGGGDASDDDGGGGGGQYNEIWTTTDDLLSTEIVTVGGISAVQAAGNPSSFGSHLTMNPGLGGSSSAGGPGGGQTETYPGSSTWLDNEFSGGNGAPPNGGTQVGRRNAIYGGAGGGADWGVSNTPGGTSRFGGNGGDVGQDGQAPGGGGGAGGGRGARGEIRITVF